MNVEGMNYESHVVEARTHGRYLVRLPAVPQAAGILVGFHGYLENAKEHLDRLASIPRLQDWALVAVDALHAFYASRSGSGRVVRGWMTRDLREEAIEDNLAYVRGIFETLRRRFGWRVPMAILGFSQGASMAWRAAVLSGHEVCSVIALAGDVPPELAAVPQIVPFPRRALLARGDRDEWYTADHLARDGAILESRGVELSQVSFSGGHEWGDDFRLAVAGMLMGSTEPPA